MPAEPGHSSDPHSPASWPLMWVEGEGTGGLEGSLFLGVAQL